MVKILTDFFPLLSFEQKTSMANKNRPILDKLVTNYVMEHSDRDAFLGMLDTRCQDQHSPEQLSEFQSVGFDHTDHLSSIFSLLLKICPLGSLSTTGSSDAQLASWTIQLKLALRLLSEHDRLTSIRLGSDTPLSTASPCSSGANSPRISFTVTDTGTPRAQTRARSVSDTTAESVRLSTHVRDRLDHSMRRLTSGMSPHSPSSPISESGEMGRVSPGPDLLAPWQGKPRKHRRPSPARSNLSSSSRSLSPAPRTDQVDDSPSSPGISYSFGQMSTSFRKRDSISAGMDDIFDMDLGKPVNSPSLADISPHSDTSISSEAERAIVNQFLTLEDAAK